MLIFTFPVLFVASLGCVYLHLGKKLNDHYNKKERYPLFLFSFNYYYLFIFCSYTWLSINSEVLLICWMDPN
jgi:hypothetical protein